VAEVFSEPSRASRLNDVASRHWTKLLASAYECALPGEPNDFSRAFAEDLDPVLRSQALRILHPVLADHVLNDQDGLAILSWGTDCYKTFREGWHPTCEDTSAP